MKAANSVSIDSELLDRMTEVELHLKYQSLSKASELLSEIIETHPAYLPAKETLRELFQKSGDSVKAQEVAQQIVLLREHLAEKCVEQGARPDAMEQAARRRLTERIDAVLKDIYETQDLQGIQTTAAARLVESLNADRCLIIRTATAHERARGFEHCRKGIASSLEPVTLQLNRFILRAISKSLKPVVFDDVLEDPSLSEHRATLEQFNIRSLLALPLVYKSKATGFIVIHRCQTPMPWREEEKTIFSTVTGHLAVAIHNAELFHEAQTKAITDQLTGVYNRRFLEERMSAELANAHQQKYPLCVALLDVDHFKSVNDTYGHAAGDTVLHKLGFLLKTNLRKGTVVARFGGEEFAVILPNSALHTAHFTMENIRKLVESNIAMEDGKAVTISVGLCEANLNDPAGLTWTQQVLIQRADENLYRAKRSGRNRVCSLSNATR